MALNQDELLKAFVDEALEHLSTIEADFLEIEKAGADIDLERVNKVFRAAHSIKGGAGFIGLPNIRDLAHAIESVLGKFRNRVLEPNREIVSALLSATDLLRRMVIGVTEQQEEMDISASKKALQAFLDATPSSDTGHRPPADPEVFLPSSTPEPAHPNTIIAPADMAEESTDGRSVYRIVFHPQTDPFFSGRNLNEVLEEIAGYGTILSRPPQDVIESDSTGDGTIIPHTLDIVLSCVLQREDLALLLEIDPKRIQPFREKAEEPSGIDLEKRSSDQPIQSDSRNPTDNNLFARLAAQTSDRSEIDSPLQQSSATAFIFPASDSSGIPPQTGKASTTARLVDSGTHSIRVQIGVLDSLINLAGELVLNRNQLVKTLSQTDNSRLQALAKRLDLITSDLQHVILKTRMRPIGDLFHRFPRLVRDIAIDLGKEVNLVLEGAEVELDRTVIEAINDPLVHMLRNAVDHGIETPEVRKSIGKPPQGRISLSASSQGGHVIIDIQDDGKGMDPEKIAQSAVQKGFLTEEQARLLSRSEKTRLIFSPGLSTSDRVTQWSGRGVGLDVVKANVEQFGGSVDIDTAPHMGTRFRIKLPLTLAIIASQLICVEGHRFAVPQVHVEELIRIPANQVKHRIEIVGNAEVLQLRGDLLPLIRLADILRIERTYLDPISNQRKPDRRYAIADRRSKRIQSVTCPEEATRTNNETSIPERPETAIDPPNRMLPRTCSDRRYRISSTLHLLVIAAGSFRYGLIVDSFQDFEEIVVKPLGKHFRQARVFSGATILGDGSIALILDVNQIPVLGGLHQLDVSAANPYCRHTMTTEKRLASEHTFADPLHLILFRNAAGESIAVPIHSVKRILRCKSKDIRWIAGHQAISLEGRDLRLILLDQDSDGLLDRPEDPWILIVFQAFGRNLGLLGKGPIDTLMTHQAIDGVSFRTSGIIGTIRIAETTILLLDLLELVQSRYPEWFADETVHRPPPVPEQQILLVEDSEFFRNHVASLLQQAGYRVITGADGQQGYEILQEEGNSIALVVTDIEMPRMNGFELIRLLRSDSRFKHLPVIALTTLADDSDRHQAMEAGVNDYQIKLDKESLLKSIARWIHR